MLLYLVLGGAALYALWRSTPHVEPGGKGGGVVFDANGNPIGQVAPPGMTFALPDDMVVLDGHGCPVGTKWSDAFGECALDPLSKGAKSPGFSKGGDTASRISAAAPILSTSATATGVGHAGKPCCAECAAKSGVIADKAQRLAQQVAAGDVTARERAAQIFELALYKNDATAQAICQELYHALQASGSGVGSMRRVRVAIDDPNISPVGYPSFDGM